MATGAPASGLLELDEDMLVTLQQVYEERFTRSEELLANIIDLLQVVAYNALVGPHVDPKKLRSLKPPTPMPRPGQKRKRRGTTLRELDALSKEVSDG